jgi:Cu(I)/Ag(I) efflux system membrane protein CusA/SilA
MVGGMVSATILTLIVIPALFLLWRGRSIDNERGRLQRFAVELDDRTTV